MAVGKKEKTRQKPMWIPHAKVVSPSGILSTELSTKSWTKSASLRTMQRRKTGSEPLEKAKVKSKKAMVSQEQGAKRNAGYRYRNCGVKAVTGEDI